MKTCQVKTCSALVAGRKKYCKPCMANRRKKSQLRIKQRLTASVKYINGRRTCKKPDCNNFPVGARFYCSDECCKAYQDERKLKTSFDQSDRKNFNGKSKCKCCGIRFGSGRFTKRMDSGKCSYCEHGMSKAVPITLALREGRAGTDKLTFYGETSRFESEE